MTLPHPKHFTNREEALSAYDDLWLPDTTQRILNFEGLSGNGKSTLLWYIANHYDTTERPRLLLDLDSDTLRSQDHALLDRIATSFTDHLPPGALRKYNRLVAKLDDEAAAIRHSPINTQIEQTATQGGQITQSPIDVAAEINMRLAGHRQAARTQLTSALVSALIPLAHCESVLLLDTYEKVRQSSDEDFRSWLEEELLEKIVTRLPAWRILLAGRENLPYRADRHRKKTLRHWTEDESRHFLASFGLTDPTLQTAIFDHCQGHPLLTDLARDVWEQGNETERPLGANELRYGISQQAAITWLYRLLVDRLPPPTNIATERVCLLYQVTYDLLRLLLPNETPFRFSDYQESLRFSIIRRSPGQPPCVHELVRQTADDWFREQHPSLHMEIHRKSYEYFRQAGLEYYPAQIYHLISFDRTRGESLWDQFMTRSSANLPDYLAGVEIASERYYQISAVAKQKLLVYLEDGFDMFATQKQSHEYSRLTELHTRIMRRMTY